MKISRLKINNYRNIKNIDIKLSGSTVFIGENNSGKSNIMRAATLPFISNELGYTTKNLTWFDINKEAKEKYYNFILENQHDIIDEKLSVEDFEENIPIVTVEAYFEVSKLDLYLVRNFACNIENKEEIIYGIRYVFSPKNIKDVLYRVKEVLSSYGESTFDSNALEKIKMNLLPIDLYTYTIKVPEKNKSVAYDELKLLRYTSLIAERDDFSQTTEKIGSKSLVKLLEMKLNTESKLIVEKEYTNFFETLKDLSGLENILNWQENSEIPNAKDFFDKISVIPNMPNMSSLLNSVNLGYSDEQLSFHGLGYRNLILLLVLLNSFIDRNDGNIYSLITLEEPEAHLSQNNQRLMASYINYFTTNNKNSQLFFSTHSIEFIDKLSFDNVVVVNNGEAFSLFSELDREDKNYLSKNPNSDLYKLLFSKSVILVEGLTEELLIRSYIRSKRELSDIQVLSFHKGFKNIMDIWIILNRNTENKLGVVRDFDNQKNAKDEHEEYNCYENIKVCTTEKYTLEPEIVNTGNNFNLLNEYFKNKYEWDCSTKEELSNKWMDSKASVMLRLCQDIIDNKLEDLEYPAHISNVIEFLNLQNKKVK